MEPTSLNKIKSHLQTKTDQRSADASTSLTSQCASKVAGAGWSESARSSDKQAEM